MKTLPWLVDAPEDFNKRCASFVAEPDLGELLALARYDLTSNQADRLAKSFARIDAARRRAIAEALPSLKLGIVSNATTSLSDNLLFVAALRRGVLLSIVNADFDQALQAAIDPQSALNQAALDLVLVHLDFRAFGFARQAFAVSSGGGADDALAYIKRLTDGFGANSGTQCILQTLAVPPISLLGSFDRALAGAVRREIHAFNRVLVDYTEQSAHYLLDIEACANEFGTHAWFDERHWNTSTIPFTPRAAPHYAERLGALVGAVRGRSAKCLVLDLDNTLWGGVIGDDGLEGLQLEEGAAVGQAHRNLQRYALELKQHGIMLAVCSKNELDNALLPFREHPGMLLKEDDFAVFIANWNDKASNLEHIAKTLSIGIDSLVFVDDNPAEREIVRQHLPQVAVPELPSDPALYVRTVACANYFEAVSLTDEDRRRADQYRANAQRAELLDSSTDLTGYLRSLEMQIEFRPFDSTSLKRITQLINKTNQFNLTTRRYAQAQVSEMQSDADVFTLQVRLKDRFGDNGMISVVVCQPEDDAWRIDTWLMSCRVLKRRVEESVCDELVRQARHRGVARLLGEYLPTAKNALVREHYAELGFERLPVCPGDEEGHTRWSLAVGNYDFKQPPIDVV